MLGVEFFPAILYFVLMFLVPESPRWPYTKGKIKEAKKVLYKIHGTQKADIEIDKDIMICRYKYLIEF